MGIEFAVPWATVLDTTDGIEWARWFVGGEVNIASSCVHRWAQSERRDEIASVFAGEDGTRRAWSFGELSREVTRLAEGLAALGVGVGDVVALFLPMSPEVAIASHACAHLGAIQLPIFSGFAAPAVAMRLRDADAKVVITANGSLRRGRVHPMKEIVDEAVADSPSVERVVVWERLNDEGVEMTKGR
jgi:acetyl-CoA synthetase